MNCKSAILLIFNALQTLYLSLDLNSIHLDSLWPWAHWIYWPLIIVAIVRAPWSILFQKDSSNIFFASCAVIFLFWHLRIHVTDGVSIHLLGTTIMTLMFRWQVALLGNALILLGMTLTTNADFQAFACNGLLMGAIPIAISYLIWRLNEWYLPANYFVYIFIAAFLAAALSILASGWISYKLMSNISNDLTPQLLDQYLLSFIPLMYPEAFLTGAIISIFVIYKPHWIATFDDNRYLKNK